MSLQTRRRYGKFLKDSSFYGAVSNSFPFAATSTRNTLPLLEFCYISGLIFSQIFHHYWFVDRPIKEHVIEAMLADGEPDIPFMLSWANEPWSARWDRGKSGQVLVAQEYGLHEIWRKHFDWLLPFFQLLKYYAPKDEYSS